MEYIEIDFDCGSSLKDSVKLLHSKAEATGKKYFGEFNGHKLTSDMTVDEAYIKCIGKTFKEFKDEQEKMRQDLIRREEEHNVAKYILPRLKMYKKLTIAYPGYDEANTPEKWDELLDKMIWSFEQAANYYEIYESIDYNNSDWKEKYKETDDKIQEGLMLFAKWFQHLGW